MPDNSPLSPEQLRHELASLPGWEERDGWLRKTYQTLGWPQTLMLANTIGYIAEAAWHHPDLSLGYAQLTVKLQTHKCRAITDLDTALARKLDEVVLWRPEPGSPLTGHPKKWVQA
ncbi:MAG: 4a-hydroxytetrahydrobiopterin dehydratase [Planctomycetaceae bacterium]